MRGTIMTKHLLKLFLAVTAVTGLLQRQTRCNPTFAESLGVGSYGDGGKHIDQPDVGSGSDWPLGIAKMPDGGYVVAGMFDLPSRYAHYNAGTSAYALLGAGPLWTGAAPFFGRKRCCGNRMTRLPLARICKRKQLRCLSNRY